MESWLAEQLASLRSAALHCTGVDSLGNDTARSLASPALLTAYAILHWHTVAIVSRPNATMTLVSHQYCCTRRSLKQCVDALVQQRRGFEVGTRADRVGDSLALVTV